MDGSTIALMALIVLAVWLFYMLVVIVISHLHHKHSIPARDAKGRFTSNVIQGKDLL